MERGPSRALNLESQGVNVKVVGAAGPNGSPGPEKSPRVRRVNAVVNPRERGGGGARRHATVTQWRRRTHTPSSTRRARVPAAATCVYAQRTHTQRTRAHIGTGMRDYKTCAHAIGVITLVVASHRHTAYWHPGPVAMARRLAAAVPLFVVVLALAGDRASAAAKPKDPYLLSFAPVIKGNGSSLSLLASPDAKASAVLLDVAPCGTIQPHVHPRSAELYLLLSGARASKEH